MPANTLILTYYINLGIKHV